MKILFVGRSTAHFSYYQSLIEALLESGHRVELLYDEEWSRSYGDARVRTFGRDHPEFSMGWSLRRTGRWRGPLFYTRELRSYADYVARPGQSPFYRERWEKYLPLKTRGMMQIGAMRWLVGTRLVRGTLGLVERIAPPDRAIVDSLREIRPDFVIVSPANMRFSEEIEYLKAAKSIGIPTALPVLSWDNLSTKGLVHVTPDLLLAWNESHRTDAMEIHRMRPEQIAITGAPFFDKWFERPPLALDRETFLRKVGLDPSRPFLLYLGSSKNIARDESWVVKAIREKSAADPALRSLQILVRPHPANADVYASVLEDDVKLWPLEGSLPDSEEAQLDFEASLRFCEGTIGINTSGMIDAVIADRPSIAVLIPEYENTQSNAAHFRYLREYDALEIAEDIDQSLAAIARILAGEDDRASRRRAFVEAFVRPHGIERSAGAVAAQAIEEHCGATAAGRHSRDSVASPRENRVGKTESGVA